MSGTVPPLGEAGALATACPASAAALICRDGKIVWASDAAAERLCEAGTPTFMGNSFEKTLRRSGASIDEGPAGEIFALRTKGNPEALPRLVRIERLELPKAALEPSGAAFELCVLNDLPAPAATPASADIDRLERANKEIKQDRDELIAILSHELRTPLTVISGYSKLLLSEQAGALSEEQRRYLEATRVSCERLNRFVVDLLDASHDPGGAICLRLEQRSLGQVIEQVIEFFEPAFEENGLGVDVAIDDDLGDAHFDVNRIEQVLTNLIGNAIKYTKPGSAVRIEAKGLESRETPGVEVAVLDNGPGIPEADRRRIFEPWVRGRRDAESTGVGLGLAICRRILDAHRGTIGVEAAPDGGSRFHFWIPARGVQHRRGR